MERHERVHLHTVEQELDHNQTRRLELAWKVSADVAGHSKDSDVPRRQGLELRTRRDQT